jgi:acyl carrier protein
MPDYAEVRAEARRLAAELFAGIPAGQCDGVRASPRSAEDAGNLPVSDLDSLSVVELTIGLETVVGIDILDDLAEFTGHTVDDLAAFAVELAARHGRPESTGLAGQPPPQLPQPEPPQPQPPLHLP